MTNDQLVLVVLALVGVAVAAHMLSHKRFRDLLATAFVAFICGFVTCWYFL